MFKRDKNRFINNLKSLNENPLGVAAFAGTNFKIDRFFTTKKLKFNNPTNNSIDTVSDRDFVLDFYIQYQHALFIFLELLKNL